MKHFAVRIEVEDEVSHEKGSKTGYFSTSQNLKPSTLAEVLASLVENDEAIAEAIAEVVEDEGGEP